MRGAFSPDIQFPRSRNAYPSTTLTPMLSVLKKLPRVASVSARAASSGAAVIDGKAVAGDIQDDIQKVSVERATTDGGVKLLWVTRGCVWGKSVGVGRVRIACACAHSCSDIAVSLSTHHLSPSPPPQRSWKA